MERDVRIALNICTFKRHEFIERNIDKLKKSRFFDINDQELYGRLQIYIIDNAKDLQIEKDEFIHLFHNRNVGGSGGFQRGIEEIRKSEISFSNVIFMDDDVEFEIESFYLLFDFLKHVEDKDLDRPVAGRMFCLDNPNIQYTAAEKWNGGAILHVEFLRNVSETEYIPGKIIYDADANYGGWWFCCFPMKFVKENDILPFFLHCDDVEYGLRCGKTPIIIEGVQVWHETFEKRMSPIIQYYDYRNSLYVNQLYGDLDMKQLINEWKERITKHHIKEEWLLEYYSIMALNDFLKGIKWLKRVDSEKYHKKLMRMHSSRYKNAICWRAVYYRYKRYIRRVCG